MSPPIKPNSDVKASTEFLLSSTLDLDQEQQEKVSGSSSCWNTSSNSNPLFTNSLQNYNNNNIISKVEEITSSDEDMFTVPEVEAEPGISSGITLDIKDHNLNDNSQTGFPGHKRRRGRNPIDKEYRRLKRLLRNRVSAQQARERKKLYVNDLESRAQELQETNSKLEEKISTLINENNMLRKVLINTRPKVDDSIEPKQDKLSKK